MRRTATRVIAAATLITAACLGINSSASAAPQCAAVITQPGGWTTVSEMPPDQPEWMGLSSIVVDPRNPDLMYLARTETPHQAVWRSDDGGCNWVNVLELASPTDLVHSKEMLDIAVGVDGTVYVAVHQRSGLFGNFLESVWVGRASGTKWERVTAGLPVPDAVPSDPNLARDFPVSWSYLYTAPSDPNVVYLVATPTSIDGFSIYASTNAGKSWEFKSGSGFGRDPQGFLGTEVAQEDHGFASLAVDPLDAKRIWVGYRHFAGNESRAQEMRLVTSTDAGASFKTVTEGPNAPLNGGVHISVYHAPDKPPHLVVMPSWTSQYFLDSTDGGENWTRVNLPFTPIGAVYFGKTDKSMIVVSPEIYTPARVARYHAKSYQWLDITPRYVFDQFFGEAFTSFHSSGISWAGKRPVFYTVVSRGTLEKYSGRW